jgi:hypothetical protein
MSAGACACGALTFDALLERGRTGGPREPERSPAQAFWEGEFHPTPVVEAADVD